MERLLATVLSLLMVWKYRAGCSGNPETNQCRLIRVGLDGAVS